MKALQIRHLSKSFTSVHALKDIQLDLEEGQMLAVLGPSGCGKTTLLRSIAGFETADSGTIEVGGHIVFDKQTNLKPEKRRIGYVPQEGVLFPHLSVAKNIGFGLSRKDRNSSRIDEMLELVGMKGLGSRMPHELSGGQQQRIALARALAPSPSLVLFDEPFSALDAGLRADLREDIKSMLKKVGATSILVTHDQEEALSMADVVAVMRNGSCVQTADPISLYKYPTDIKVAKFVGDATIIKAQVLNGNIKSLFGNLPVASGCPKDCELASVMIRPEQFIIGKPDLHLPGQVGGKVLKTFFYGHDAMVYLKLDDSFGGDEIQIRVMGTPVFEPDEYVSIQIDGEVMAYVHEDEALA
ncbi:ABC transporter ATP-binding protein [Sporosarcina sp. BI001-red]|uniref:ABC transporter ATP-binding protein n=1 Tax=Sporosarcina sp. BI001-red TaxID=2282866 RepID=UPI000E2254F4|nr:ABC transporter ATP-binding protein [Sporosarcina sp. BI001-red]REB05210.1 ABC transporter ATP-binding protein [Sporosarcina sp. BI001-red]